MPLLELKTDISALPGVGPKRAKLFNKLGIFCLQDLVHYYPRDYEDRSEMREISALMPGDTACVKGMVADTPKVSRIRKGLDIVKIRVVDDTGSMDIVFFNQSFVKDSLKKGEWYVFFGKIYGSLFKREMRNPVFEPEETAGRTTGAVVPIYRLTSGLSSKMIQNAVIRTLSEVLVKVEETLPGSLRLKYELCHISYALSNIHMPSSPEALEMARKRLIFEELFTLSLGLLMLKTRRKKEKVEPMQRVDLSEFLARLPFKPTRAQLRSIGEVAADMASGTPMNRLVQGDVGSGKTLVAAAACYIAFKNGFQSALMVPTEILANQHYKTLKSLLEPCGMRVGILTGSLGKKEKDEGRGKVETGEYDVCVGTHALISEGVAFSNLGLVITDEQHRFGVRQRATLSAKGKDAHILVMSATPIPRTLALIMYGDLDVSVIDELPPGRQRVDTYLVGEEMRPRIEAFVRRLVSEGRQVYIICPLVEEDESSSDRKAVEAYTAHIAKEVYPKLRVAYVHGRMKPAEKTRIMKDFADGKVDILVATTVVEVGVDTPNAALIVIENAERFGLSQLHQLRGRVGRGKHKSYCVMFCATDNEVSKERLEVICKTNDGFKISEKDMELRGPGDFFGSRQHGLPVLRIADLSYDSRILKTAQTAAAELLEKDPNLESEENRGIFARVKEMFSREQGDIFN